MATEQNIADTSREAQAVLALTRRECSLALAAQALDAEPGQDAAHRAGSDGYESDGYEMGVLARAEPEVALAGEEAEKLTAIIGEEGKAALSALSMSDAEVVKAAYEALKKGEYPPEEITKLNKQAIAELFFSEAETFWDFQEKLLFLESGITHALPGEINQLYTLFSTHQSFAWAPDAVTARRGPTQTVAAIIAKIAAHKAIGDPHNTLPLPQDMLCEIFSRLPTADVGLFAQTSKASRQSIEETRQYQIFMRHVYRGEQKEAAALLADKPWLVLRQGTFDDLAWRNDDPSTPHARPRISREFKQCSAFQYALWAGDWHMWMMLAARMTHEAQWAQIQEIETGRAPWIKAHGKFFALKPLTDAQQYYAQNANNWTDSVRATYWCKTIGGLQRLLPAHVINEYCRPDRPFDPTPDFLDPTALPRHGDGEGNDEYGLDWWLTKVYDGGKMGDLGRLRASYQSRARLIPLPHDYLFPLSTQRVAADAKALTLLSNTRLQQYEELVATLYRQLYANTPCTLKP